MLEILSFTGQFSTLEFVFIDELGSKSLEIEESITKKKK